MRARATFALFATGMALVMLPARGQAQPVDAPCKDAVITRIVQARLSVDREIGQFRIGVATSECVVTLSGCVESREQAKKAKELAKRLIKVKVKNELKVCTIAPRKSKARTHRS
jgi:osmotically-inducible protein OsmY